MDPWPHAPQQVPDADGAGGPALHRYRPALLHVFRDAGGLISPAAAISIDCARLTLIGERTSTECKRIIFTHGWVIGSGWGYCAGDNGDRYLVIAALRAYASCRAIAVSVVAIIHRVDLPPRRLTVKVYSSACITVLNLAAAVRDSAGTIMTSGSGHFLKFHPAV